MCAVHSKNRIIELFAGLRKTYGDPQRFWPYWCAKKKTKRDREMIIIGAVLTQRMGWRNVDMALINLRQAGLLSLAKIARLKNLKKLTQLIRPVGFFQTKPQRLFDTASFVMREYGSVGKTMKENSAVLREKLLAIKGIGPETADTILLYALDKPVFVIDEYTKRFAQQHRLSKDVSYEHLQNLFETKLSKNPRLFQNFHALIIVSQKGGQGSMMKKI
jgi:endonuclease-3 related protein